MIVAWSCSKVVPSVGASVSQNLLRLVTVLQGKRSVSCGTESKFKNTVSGCENVALSRGLNWARFVVDSFCEIE